MMLADRRDVSYHQRIINRQALPFAKKEENNLLLSANIRIGEIYPCPKCRQLPMIVNGAGYLGILDSH